MLADFVSAALTAHHREYPWNSAENLGCYDIVKLLGLRDHTFWEPMDHSFWANLKPLDEGTALLRLLQQEHHEVYLSTSPALSPGCSSGKHEWVNRILPDMWKRTFIGSSKDVFAKLPDAVLIDDCDANVDKFRSAGGIGILWPQPWNSAHTWTQGRIGYVVRFLKNLKGVRELCGD